MTSLAAIPPLLERLLGGAPLSLRSCLCIIGIGGAAHGLALGASSGHWLLALYAAIKVPLLLLGCCAASLPNFYVLHAVLGLHADFGAACTGLLAAQAAAGAVLGATAPLFVWLLGWVDDPYLLTVADALLFAAAAVGGQIVLVRHYAPLLQRDRRHRLTVSCWIVLYAFFGIQLAWVLRPFLGTEGFAVQFLRPTALQQNAYVVLFEHLLRLWR